MKEDLHMTNEELAKLLADEFNELQQLKQKAIKMALGKDHTDYYGAEEKCEALKAVALLSIASDYKIKMLVDSSKAE